MEKRITGNSQGPVVLVCYENPQCNPWSLQTPFQFFEENCSGGWSPGSTCVRQGRSDFPSLQRDVGSSCIHGDIVLSWPFNWKPAVFDWVCGWWADLPQRWLPPTGDLRIIQVSNVLALVVSPACAWTLLAETVVGKFHCFYCRQMSWTERS